MRTHSRTMVLAGIGTAAVLGLGGCGAATGDAAGNGAEAKREIVTAFGELGASDRLGVEVTLEGSRADLERINAAQPAADRLDDADLDLLVSALGGRIVAGLSAAEGSSLADGAESGRTSVQLGDRSLADVVLTGDLLYLRVDAAWIARQLDTDVDDVRELFVGNDPVVDAPANALLDSEWVSVDLDRAVKALRELGFEDDDDLLATPDPAAGYGLLESLRDSFESDVRVTAIDGGYHVVAPARKTADAVHDDVAALIGEYEADSLSEEIAGMAAEEIAFDLLLENGKLSGVNLDLVQFLGTPDVDANLVLEVRLDQEVAAVRAPAEATVVDVEGIIEALAS
ncbi:hypothetical protein KIH74_30495 [Kineosporia sp. J2-2]|uniref:Uncharacterized protein n=1 Tax=Kineosporia corallincola TaxID=2835133 RepID=A0ABS5TQC6_9ACTN|nr:hypothetical protein [Kineosporia corallincola]MBT0773314.1 hypothetical protein [Kineosporia corallincola]